MRTESVNQALALESYVKRGDFSVPYGSQWGDTKSGWLLKVTELCSEFFSGRRVLEIGSGGGRWSKDIWRTSSSLICVDGTEYSEMAIRGSFDVPSTVSFLVSKDGKISSVEDSSIDTVFSFDTFVHFDPSLIEQYVSEIRRVLKTGGVFFFHYALAQEGRPLQPYFRYVTDQWVKEIVNTNGLSIVDGVELVFGGNSAGSKLVVVSKE